jgi:hypothetical protein
LLLAGFLAGMLIPNFIYRFSWKQQAFSAVYLLETYGKTEAGGIEATAGGLEKQAETTGICTGATEYGSGYRY